MSDNGDRLTQLLREQAQSIYKLCKEDEFEEWLFVGNNEVIILCKTKAEYELIKDFMINIE